MKTKTESLALYKENFKTDEYKEEVRLTQIEYEKGYITAEAERIILETIESGYSPLAHIEVEQYGVEVRAHLVETLEAAGWTVGHHPTSTHFLII